VFRTLVESAVRLCGALREITERYATQIGRWPPLIVTGGDAEAIGRACDFVDRVVPDLCLEGMALAYDYSMSDAMQERGLSREEF
jgi:pantothenate kinase type III